MKNKDFAVGFAILALYEDDELFRNLTEEIFDIDKLWNYHETEWNNVGDGEIRLHLIEVLKEKFPEYIK